MSYLGQFARPVSFYVLAALFCLFIVFLYGPMIVVFVLSFQGPNGGLTFPMNGVSLRWFEALFGQERTGDVAGALLRSLVLSIVAALVTIILSFFAGLGFRRRFVGNGLVFYFVVASLIMPGILIGLGIALSFRLLSWRTDWMTSALGAQLTWTLPFGMLIMFAVLGRFNRAIDEAAIDLGANNWQRITGVTIPIVLPGLIGVALFGFTLSYDEFSRTLVTVGSHNTLPLEIWAMTTNVTSPTLYALGTVTTAVSFAVVIGVIALIYLLQKKRGSAV